MKDEVHSIFDEFETDEETGEVLVPRATVGMTAEEEAYGGAEDEELPVLQFDFKFEDEEFAGTEEMKEEDEEAVLRSIDDALAAQMAVTLGPVDTEPEEGKQAQKGKKKQKNLWLRFPMWCRVLMIVLLVLCLGLGFLAGTNTGRSLLIKIAVEYMGGRMNIEELTPTPMLTQEATPMPTQTENPNLTPTVTPVPTVEPRQEDYCFNVLLIGVEALPQLGGGGRSDSMILVSVNSKDKKIHMVSLMRDMYVQIPGHADNKLNAAYAYGGAPLLVDTIELNFQIKIDGYVKVGFDSFEWIIDRLGGVEINLTATEAEYLRTHDYISNPANRNVVAGSQLMNGNQVLGYCRVRYVPTANGTDSDFGRTERQRTVLNKIFNKYKNSSIFTMLDIFNDCLPQVTTNLSKEDMQEVLEMVVEEGILSMDTMRIPVAGGYSNANVILDNNTKPSQVLAVQWSKNINALQEFIFGPEE